MRSSPARASCGSSSSVPAQASRRPPPSARSSSACRTTERRSVHPGALVAGADSGLLAGHFLLRRELLQRCEALGREPQLLLADMERVGRIRELLEQQAHGGRVAALYDLLPSQENLADGVGLALVREL